MGKSSFDKHKKELIVSCQKYLGLGEIKEIEKSIELALKYHGNDLRRSGEPFIVHPLSTAILLTKLRADKNTLIAAILHDSIEDTNLTATLIKKEFGAEVLSLVESVTKLSKIRIKKSWFPFGKVEKEEIPEFERQTETLRKMLVAMAKDIRVILIKLADKIHNLKTLRYLDLKKRERIASEALEIYAPIAARLGMGEWKGELEDLSFSYILPAEFEKLTAQAIPKIQEREKYLQKITKKSIRPLLEENYIEAEINYRAKRWYSLYHKLQKYDGDLSKIYDLIAVRIIVNSVEDCYGVLGAIHGRWKPLIGRIKDFIALPKPNGYQSIHTTVFCEEGQIVEFQIRTWEMHQQAEFGVAAHWVYGKAKSSKAPTKDEVSWLKDFSKEQKKISSPQELISSLIADLFKDRIFVFTPAGDVKDLPNNATPVDFAYSVHTDLGNKCSGAIVNGKIAPLEKKLENGDIVEIIKRKSAKPHSDWLKFVKTHLARTNIRRGLKT